MTRLLTAIACLFWAGALLIIPATARADAGAPHIEGIAPDAANFGEIVGIRGSGFSTDKTKNAVRFGDVPARVITATETLLGVEVPRGATRACQVTVEVNGHMSNGADFHIAMAASEITVQTGQRTRVELTVDKPLLDVHDTGTGTFKVANSDAAVLIHFWNMSPDIVSIVGGNEQTVVTSGGTPNTATIAILPVIGNRHYTIDFSWESTVQEIKVKYISIWKRVDLRAKAPSPAP